MILLSTVSCDSDFGPDYMAVQLEPVSKLLTELHQQAQRLQIECSRFMYASYSMSSSWGRREDLYDEGLADRIDEFGEILFLTKRDHDWQPLEKRGFAGIFSEQSPKTDLQSVMIWPDGFVFRCYLKNTDIEASSHFISFDMFYEMLAS